MHAAMACDHGAIICKLPARCSINIKVQHAHGILEIEVEKEKERQKGGRRCRETNLQV